MSKEEDVEVKIPKAFAEEIQKRSWFKFYSDFEEFMLSAARDSMENWDKVTKHAGFRQDQGAQLITVFPELPQKFIEHIRRLGKKTMSLAEIVEEYKKWKRLQDLD